MNHPSADTFHDPLVRTSLTLLSMAFNANVKPCGHSECTLNTPECCGCEDTRPIATVYPCYIDGLGYTTNNETQTRFKDYCPPCRDQFQRLGPWMKRCSCGVVRCDLTTQKCCVCLDQRSGHFLTKYLVASQYCSQYCASCKFRLTAPPTHKKSFKPRTKVESTKSASSSHETNNSAPATTPDINISLPMPQDAELVLVDLCDAVEEASHVRHPLKNGPMEVVLEIGDASDYEIVSHDGLSACPSQSESGRGICAKIGRSVAEWFRRC